MVAGDTTVYLANSSLLGVVWLAILALATSHSGRARRIALVGSVPAVAMAGAYFGMHLEILTFETEGRDQSVVRFFGYTLVALSLAYLLRTFIRLERRSMYLLFGLLLVAYWSQFVSWFVSGAVESLVTLVTLAMFASIAYLLYVPYNTIARNEGGKRRLFYAKIRDVFLVCNVALVLTSVASEQVLEILTTFVSTVAAGYIDLVLMATIGFLTVSAAGIFEETDGSSDDTVGADVTAGTAGDD